MPIIQMHLLEGRTVAQKRKVVKAVTDAVVESLGVPRDTVRIIISEMPSEHFAVGGETTGEKRAAATGSSKNTA